MISCQVPASPSRLTKDWGPLSFYRALATCQGLLKLFSCLPPLCNPHNNNPTL